MAIKYYSSMTISSICVLRLRCVSYSPILLTSKHPFAHEWIIKRRPPWHGHLRHRHLRHFVNRTRIPWPISVILRSSSAHSRGTASVHGRSRTSQHHSWSGWYRLWGFIADDNGVSPCAVPAVLARSVFCLPALGCHTQRLNCALVQPGYPTLWIFNVAS